MAYSDRLKRLIFIKQGSPEKFEKALMRGELVPTAKEMNVLYPKKEKFYHVCLTCGRTVGKVNSDGECYKCMRRNEKGGI